MNLASSMEMTLWFLVSCTLKSTLVLGLAAGVVGSARRWSAAARHQIWALGILSCLALPAFTLLLPSWHSTRISQMARFWSPKRAVEGDINNPSLTSQMVDAVAASPRSHWLYKSVLILWALGVLSIVVRLVGGLARLSLVSARAKPVAGQDWQAVVVEFRKRLGILRPVRVLQCADADSMPLTWGILRPCILLPSKATEWTLACRRTVLLHELAHIARHDCLLQICAELTRGLYWFNPIVWMGAASLRDESERACDDLVLGSGIDASDYANQLLDFARSLKNGHRTWSAALAIARPTSLERRFVAMLNPSLNRNRITRRNGALLKLASLCLLLPLATLRLPAQNVSGRLTGTVFDVSGGAVPNATIMMTNHKANTLDMTTTDAEGSFVFTALPAGDYQMRVLKQGFAEYQSPEVVLVAGRDLALTVKLEMGSLKETIDVHGEVSRSATPVVNKKPVRIRIGGNVQAARLQNKVQPIYPDSAKVAGSQGSVVLYAVIGMDGKPMSLQVLNSQIDPALARAAVEAVSHWKYTPTLLNGEPIEVDTVITVNFTLAP